MVRVSRVVFEALVEEALASLPERFLGALHNVEILVEDAPGPEDLQAAGVPPGQTLFGLYQGIPLPQRGVEYGNTLPDRIVIYQRPLEQACRSRAEMVRQIYQTVYHELGHYFGMTDEEMEALEREP